jgi:hypothetical protein
VFSLNVSNYANLEQMLYVKEKQMANFYSPKEKARGIQALIENFGNTRRASAETGIPERTLIRWRGEYSPKTILMHSDNQDTVERTILENFIQIRNDLVDQVQSVAKKMSANPELVAELAITYGRLIDRLIKAQQLVSAHSFQIIILYEDPEGFVRQLSDDIPF